MRVVVLLDAGHGEETKGKRSPDGSLLEYRYCREIVSLLAERLRENGTTAVIITPEDNDVPLRERCNRANTFAESTNYKCILVSVHINAAGSGSSWLKAKGWQAHVYTRASEASKNLAESLAKAAEDNGLKVRRPLPKQGYWESDFAIVRNTIMPAVLTENLFMDNKEEVRFLLSDEGRETIVKLHLEGIMTYINELLL